MEMKVIFYKMLILILLQIEFTTTVKLNKIKLNNHKNIQKQISLMNIYKLKNITISMKL